MPRPSELTPEQRRAEGRRLAPERREADRDAAPLFAQMLAEPDEQASEEQVRAQLLRERRRVAHRVAAGLFADQQFIHGASEAELREALPAEEVDEILAYRASHSSDGSE